jgi:hypothetical protein
MPSDYVQKLEAFKKYVHERFDALSVPQMDGVPCRVGARFDFLTRILQHYWWIETARQLPEQDDVVIGCMVTPGDPTEYVSIVRFNGFSFMDFHGKILDHMVKWMRILPRTYIQGMIPALVNGHDKHAFSAPELPAGPVAITHVSGEAAYHAFAQGAARLANPETFQPLPSWEDLAPGTQAMWQDVAAAAVVTSK